MDNLISHSDEIRSYRMPEFGRYPLIIAHVQIEVLVLEVVCAFCFSFREESMNCVLGLNVNRFLIRLRNNREYVELNDLCKLLNAIQIDSRLGFSVVSFFRQAIILREIWLGDGWGMLVCGAASVLLLATGAAI